MCETPINDLCKLQQYQDFMKSDKIQILMGIGALQHFSPDKSIFYH